MKGEDRPETLLYYIAAVLGRCKKPEGATRIYTSEERVELARVVEVLARARLDRSSSSWLVRVCCARNCNRIDFCPDACFKSGCSKFTVVEVGKEPPLLGRVGKTTWLRADQQALDVRSAPGTRPIPCNRGTQYCCKLCPIAAATFSEVLRLLEAVARDAY